MNQRPKIDLYCLCWNEARIIPYFLRHYADLVDRFFIFDNHSTDGSVARLSGDPRVRLFQFDVTGDSFVEAERRLSDVMWKSSRGAADWVVVVDMDEHIHHPDLRAHLAMCRRDGITAIQATGYEMIADAFPPADTVLSEAVTTGFRYAESLDKLCLFDPNAIEESHFRAGRHSAAPSGRIVWDETRSVKLLHYKQLGLDYFIKRTGELRTGLRKGDLRNGWGAHYARGPLSLSRASIIGAAGSGCRRAGPARCPSDGAWASHYRDAGGAEPAAFRSAVRRDGGADHFGTVIVRDAVARGLGRGSRAASLRRGTGYSAGQRSFA